MNLTQIHISNFFKLFDRGGCILDFTRSELDDFVASFVGITPCETYQLPMTKALKRCLNDLNDAQIKLLLFSLFEYYETNYINELDKNSSYSKSLKKAYCICKKIIQAESKSPDNYLTEIFKSDLSEHFDSTYMNNQIDILLRTRTSNPTEAIGKSKELVESCCKTVLAENNVEIDEYWNTSQLVKQTMQCLNIDADDINSDLPAGKIIKRILSSLGNISSSLAELRNHYGGGHGRTRDFKGLSVRHAKLAVGSSITLVEYLWDAHTWRINQSAK